MGLLCVTIYQAPQQRTGHVPAPSLHYRCESRCDRSSRRCSMLCSHLGLMESAPCSLPQNKVTFNIFWNSESSIWSSLGPVSPWHTFPAPRTSLSLLSVPSAAKQVGGTLVPAIIGTQHSRNTVRPWECQLGWGWAAGWSRSRLPSSHRWHLDGGELVLWVTSSLYFLSFCTLLSFLMLPAFLLTGKAPARGPALTQQAWLA